MHQQCSMCINKCNTLFIQVTCNDDNGDRCKEGSALPQGGMGPDAQHKVEKQYKRAAGNVAQRQCHSVVGWKARDKLVGAPKEDARGHAEQGDAGEDWGAVLGEEGVCEGHAENATQTKGESKCGGLARAEFAVKVLIEPRLQEEDWDGWQKISQVEL